MLVMVYVTVTAVLMILTATLETTQVFSDAVLSIFSSLVATPAVSAYVLDVAMVWWTMFSTRTAMEVSAAPEDPVFVVWDTKRLVLANLTAHLFVVTVTSLREKSATVTTDASPTALANQTIPIVTRPLAVLVVVMDLWNMVRTVMVVLDVRLPVSVCRDMLLILSARRPATAQPILPSV